MNKLKEYRDNEAIICDSTVTHHVAGESGFKEDFDAAIALDLPVKFHNWTSSKNGIKKYQNLVIENGSHSKSEKELYQYWINNIYKPE